MSEKPFDAMEYFRKWNTPIEVITEYNNIQSLLEDSMTATNQLQSAMTLIDQNHWHEINDVLDQSNLSIFRELTLTESLTKSYEGIMEALQSSTRMAELIDGVQFRPLDLDRIHINKLVEIERSVPETFEYRRADLEAAEEATIQTMHESGYFDKGGISEEAINETIDKTENKPVLQKIMTNRIVLFHLALGIYFTFDLQGRFGLSLADFMAYCFGVHTLSQTEDSANKKTDEK